MGVDWTGAVKERQVGGVRKRTVAGALGIGGIGHGVGTVGTALELARRGLAGGRGEDGTGEDGTGADGQDAARQAWRATDRSWSVLDRRGLTGCGTAGAAGRQGTVGRGEDGTRRGLWRMGQARTGRNGTARMRSGRDRNKASRTGGKGLAGRHGSDEAGTWIGLGSGPDGQGKVWIGGIG
jgi:hypothetical protein